MIAKGQAMVTRKAMGWLSIAAVAAGSLMLGGCDNGLKEKNTALTQENTELHQQLDQTRKELESTQENLAKVQAEKAAPAAAPEASKPAANGPAAIGKAGGDENLGAGVSIENNARTTRVRVAGDVLFGSGSATLKTSARRTLAKVASLLKTKYGSRAVRVEGYTDSDPIRHSRWKSNEELSQARADAVKTFLASQGVHHVEAVGMGSAHPRATKAQSRRVEIVVSR